MSLNLFPARSKSKLQTPSTLVGDIDVRVIWFVVFIYAEQLVRWLEFFDREQLLVVEANDLRADPQNTMNEVFAFLGLDSFTMSTENGEKNSDYPPMDPEMRKTLLEYFKPYNADLEELLGQKFNWD
jgi:hypothetical protein